MANPKELRIAANVNRLDADIYSEDGIRIARKRDVAVPDFFPGRHNGKQMFLDIDVDTGQIKNWPKVDRKALAKLVHSV